MPITNEELRNNYYLAVVVYCCDYGVEPYTATNPATGSDWAFTLSDDGDLPHPQPYISFWDVKGKSEPTDGTLEATCSMAMINACHDALYPPPLDLKSLQARLSALESAIAAIGAVGSAAAEAKLADPSPVASARRLDMISQLVGKLTARLHAVESAGAGDFEIIRDPRSRSGSLSQ